MSNKQIKYIDFKDLKPLDQPLTLMLYTYLYMNFLKPNNIHFAPMEGITGPAYRQAIAKLYPQWDSYSTDFLRIPTVGGIRESRVIEHFGNSLYNNQVTREKTIFQILTTERAQTTQGLYVIQNLNIPHLDLNLGCPSRKVNSHGGGSFLLSEVKTLASIINKIRENHTGFFSVKMRIGYRDDQLFNSLLTMLEDQGVDAITLHARTRDQLYKGIADWSYIKKAVNLLSIPLIGNGDIWTTEDINNIFNETNCHGVMIARGAMKTPWLAELYKSKHSYTSQELREIRKEKLPTYYKTLYEEYKKKNLEDVIILKRFKAVSRYLFDDFNQGMELKSKFLRLKRLEDFFMLLSDF